MTDDELDRLLRSVAPPQPSAALRAAVLAAAPRPRPSQPGRRWWWATAAGWTAAACAGVLAGVFAPEVATSDELAWSDLAAADATWTEDGG